MKNSVSGFQKNDPLLDSCQGSVSEGILYSLALTNAWDRMPRPAIMRRHLIGASGALFCFAGVDP
ncbi:MAG: hypothetical protein NUV34_00550, partial [Sulfuricaulis sp.]|nr:hypothetical protein [Sulfuricaulis sp.]